jgi:hypothetical protein
LDGTSNFLSWKVTVAVLLEENDLWDIVKDVVPLPTDLQQLVAHKKKEVWASHISEKKMTKEVFDALVSLYQSENIIRKMILRSKLRSIEMTRSDLVTIYLMKVTEICDKLAVVGEKVVDVELVNIALNGFSASWEPFVKGICAHENLPNFERLWDDSIQEETQMESKVNKKGGEENLALFGQTNKGSGKELNKGKGKSEESTSQSRKKDWRKIKCFICHKKKGKGK